MRMHGDTTEQKIIHAANSLFGSHGYDGVSMATIAAEVGITKPSLYHFFENKEAIYHTVMESFLQSIEEVFDRASSSAPKALLSSVIEEIIELSIENGNVMMHVDASVLKSKKKDGEYLCTKFQGLFQKAAECLGVYAIANPHLSTYVLLNAVHGYLKWSPTDPYAVDIHTFSTFLSSMLEHTPNQLS